MGKAFNDEVEKLFTATKDLQSFDEIRPHCEAFNSYVESLNLSVGTLGKNLSSSGFYKKFRSIPLIQGKNAESVPKHDAQGNVTGNELKHYVLTLCGLTNDQWAERNKTSRVSERLTSTDSDGNNGIEIKPNEYIDITAKLLESDDPHEIAVGLIAATGRRPHEILARGKFTQVEGESYQAMFEGQGKKRGEKPVFKIYTLFPVSYLKQRLIVLRRDTAALIKQVANQYPTSIPQQNEAIESARGNSLRRVVQEYFGGKESKQPLLNFRHGQEQNDCKALRAACAALITERECNGSIGAKMLFAAHFLGHITETEKPTDRDLKHVATTIGYLDYFVNEPVDYPSAPERVKTANVKILPDDLARVKEFQEKWECSQHEVIKRLLDSGEEVLKLQKQVLELQSQANQNSQINHQINTTEETEMIPVQDVNESNLIEVVKSLMFEVESLKNKGNRKSVVTPKSADVTELPTEQLKAVRTPEAVEEKINRAFQAITHHNNEVATDNSERYYIGNTSLRDLSGCNGLLVKTWIENHKTLVDDHNNKFGLGQYHNKGKADIKTVVNY